MQRRVLDIILTSVGLLLTVVLFVAGGLLTWAHNFANSNVHDQLAEQKIFFPPKGSPALAPAAIGPYLNRYAGQELLSGPQAGSGESAPENPRSSDGTKAAAPLPAPPLEAAPPTDWTERSSRVDATSCHHSSQVFLGWR